jgi:hypothetical protein
MAVVLEISTIAELLGIDDPERARKNVASLIKKGKLAVSSKIPGPLRGEAALCAFDTARGLLDSPLGSLFGQAWTTAHDLRRYCDQSAFPPGSTNEHPLRKHEIALRRDPEVEVTLNGQPTGVKVQFELKLAMEFDGAVLIIRDGRIVSARVGDCRGEGSYACGAVKLFERKTSKFRIPGSMTFGEGISLGTLHGAPA